MTFHITLDGKVVDNACSMLDVVGKLHRIQGQSASHALQYEGYGVTDEEGRDISQYFILI